MEIFAQTLSQLPSYDWGAMIVQGGVGAFALLMLRWFMGQNNTALRNNTNAVDRLARAQLILVLSLKQADATAKEQARSVLGELEDDMKERRDSKL